jgi:NTE family protein
MDSSLALNLSFSGGGFRAALYCLGVYRRLIELGLQNNIVGLSSVSCGSITAGKIMCALMDGHFSSAEDFDERVTNPLISFCQIRLRNQIMKRYIPPMPPRRRFSQLLPNYFEKYLFKNTTFKDLPDEPEWSVNTTCLNSGRRVRFKKSDFGANITGYSTDFQKTKVSFAVACSAAFPMMFAPLRLYTHNAKFIYKYDWQKKNWGDSPKVPNPLYLSDGGVYDNLGSEKFIRSKIPFIICDASAFLEEWDYKKRPNWFSLINRPLDTGLDQVVKLRRRLLYRESEKKYGYQLLLRDPIQKFIDDPDEYGRLSDKKFITPTYRMMSGELQYYLSRLRTDIDGFHDIEVKSLMWSGAVKIDFVVKRYLQNNIAPEMINDTPKLPDYPVVEIERVLKIGMKRKYLSNLHSRLR